MKKLLSLICAAALALSCVAAVLPGAAAEGATPSVGTTYYVSSKTGKGGNDGRSEAKPFGGLGAIDWKNLQPGDQVLLEKGSEFDGFIHLVDVRGTEAAPIKIGTYGEGAKPRINGKGQGIWFQDYGQQLDNAWHKNQGYVSSTILLYDCDFIEIKGLEITNAVPNEESRFQPNEYQGDSVRGSMDRTGVAGAAKNSGTMEHIYLDDLYIHDVDGNIQDKHMNNGGIQLNALKPVNESETGIARYDDVRITNCTVENVSRAGICVGYTYQWSKFTGSAISDQTAQTYGHTNLYIGNNFVKDAGNDAIVALYSFRPVVESNISDGAGADLPTYVGGTQRFCAGIWPWKCKDAIFQYNEVYNTVGQGNGDGQAFDVDWSDGTIYQYNYSHNNGMGPILFCLTEAYSGVYRYNLSQNDLGCYMTLQGNPNAQIYNNVFYTGPGKSIRVLHEAGSKNDGNAWIANNIFYNNGGTVVENWTGTGGSKTYTNNLFYGFTTTPTDTNKVVVTEADKVFVDPGKAPASTTGIITARATFDGFRLKSDSPAVNAGVKVSNNGGKDFFGNSLDNSPDIGMYDSRTPVLTLSSETLTVDNTAHTISKIPGNATAKTLKDALSVDAGITVEVRNSGDTAMNDSDPVTMTCKVVISTGGNSLTYTLVTDTDKALKSSSFEVKGTTINVPFTALSKTTAQNLLDGVTAAVTATVQVVDSNGSAVSSATELDTGMKLVITAQDSADNKNEYTVAIKNTYNYVSDFVANQQGNVWFAQAHQADGSYSNMTQWQSEWNCWGDYSSPYRAVGLDGLSGKGILCDSVSASRTDVGYGMAFRASATGVLELSFAHQPQLRNVNNSGAVKLVITKNGVTLPGREYVLPNDKTALNIAPFSITVAAGDMIRLEARNTGAVVNASFHISPVITYLAVVPTISSDEYTVDVAGKTITNVPYGTDKAVFLEKITRADGVAVKLVNALDTNEVAVGTAVTTGMRLEVTLNNEAPAYYVITVLSRPVNSYENYDRTSWTATAGSVETENSEAPGWGDGVASFALDGDTTTKWHSAYGGCTREQVWITVDMKEQREIARVSYLPRQSGGPNGKYRQYEIQVSTDNQNWTTVKTGTWGASDSYSDLQHATFTPVIAQYVKFIGVSTAVAEGADAAAGRIFGTAAEINVAKPIYE